MERHSTSPDRLRRAQDGWLPLHLALRYNASEGVVEKLMTSYPEGATVQKNVRGRVAAPLLGPTPNNPLRSITPRCPSKEWL